MNFDHSSPIYLQLASTWRRLIASQEWEPGARIDSVRDLAVRYGVNPNTVQRALTELEREGLAISQRTQGRYITEDEQLIVRTRQALAKELISGFVTEAKQLGLDRSYLIQELTLAMEVLDEKPKQ